jgi:flagellar hook-length control protein FliK
VDSPKTNLKEDAEPNIVKDLKDDSSHRSSVRSTDAPPATNGTKESGQIDQPSVFQARDHQPVFEQIAAKIIDNSGVRGTDRETELRVRLSPPELGGVQVHLTASSQGVSARLVVDQEMTKQLLENHAGSLKQRLSESGIQLGSFHVSRHPWSTGGERQKGNDTAPELSDPADGIDPVKSVGQARAVAASSARMGSINVLA